AVERYRHTRDPKQEKTIPQNQQPHKDQSPSSAQFAQIADPLHSSRQQHVSGTRRYNDSENCNPRIEITDMPHRATTSLTDFGRCRRCVSSGPLVTNPTPLETSAIPSQRVTLTCSCRKNLAIKARRTYPNELAGRTYVRSAHESAVM